MIRFTLSALIALLLLPNPAFSFCGFYVAKGGARLFNKASQVVLVRDGNRTVITMANDFRGDPKEFAVVIPVPTFIERGQIHVAEKALIDHLDAYSAPRLVEYFDPDPCTVNRVFEMARARQDKAGNEKNRLGRSLGVTIEASYTVGEYDILILSAKQSKGLETWLRQNGYGVPRGASAVLGSYLKQGMRFFVAKVNLTEQTKLGYSFLRPIQVAYESAKFMLPIRLGIVNAEGPQELFVYTLTRKGRVETTNYRTVKLPTGMDLPPYLKNEGQFGKFYKAMFSRQLLKQDRRAVFLEYAWDMGWCDPCAADPLSNQELGQLGVFWLKPDPGENQGNRRPQAKNVFVTRLHVRYDAEHFPEDLVFQETADRSNFQGRYVLRHPWKGKLLCPRSKEYEESLLDRQKREAQNLASLTGWDIHEIRSAMKLPPEPAEQQGLLKWWERIWKN